MLDKIKEVALEKYAGDEQLAEAFLEGFTKEAFDLKSFNEGVGSAVGKGVGGTMIGLGIAGFSKALQNVNMGGLHNQFMQALEHAVATNPVLKSADKQKVVQYAETIFKFAPHVATDPNVLSSVLSNAIHGESLDPMTIRTLTDLEGRYVDNHSSTSFTPKTYA